MSEDLAAVRRRLVVDLPGRIALAIDGYDGFAATVPPEDANGSPAKFRPSNPCLDSMQGLASARSLIH